ncbi:MAG: TraR/DksA family transcriptional regulator [Acidimicrobiales bacterium]
MSSTVESTARAQLEAERVHLLRQLGELGGEGEGMRFDENFADSSQVAAEQGEVRALAGNLRALLVEVERALGKLDAGTYGRCEVCGEPIAEARLEAMPATRYCVNHA